MKKLSILIIFLLVNNCKQLNQSKVSCPINLDRIEVNENNVEFIRLVPDQKNLEPIDLKYGFTSSYNEDSKNGNIFIIRHNGFSKVGYEFLDKNLKSILFLNTEKSLLTVTKSYFVLHDRESDKEFYYDYTGKEISKPSSVSDLQENPIDSAENDFTLIESDYKNILANKNKEPIFYPLDFNFTYLYDGYFKIKLGNAWAIMKMPICSDYSLEKKKSILSKIEILLERKNEIQKIELVSDSSLSKDEKNNFKINHLEAKMFPYFHLLPMNTFR